MQSARGDVRISVRGSRGSLHLPDIFFSQFERMPSMWLSHTALPEFPLRQWDTRELRQGITLTNPSVPVLFGEHTRLLRAEDGASGKRIHLPIDIVGSVFLMLSRYEEAVLPERDHHQRFPSSASLAYRSGFLDRPIVDEYLEILWTAMEQIWGLSRPSRRARTLVSCDVDHPFAFARSLTGIGRHVIRDLVKRQSPKRAVHSLVGGLSSRWGSQSHDPYHIGVTYIMDTNERAGRSVAFNFIPEVTNSRFDKSEPIDHPSVRALLREVHNRGHEIGVHPGYNTFRQPDAMARSILTLRRVLEEESIAQTELGGRQHYLRWETPTTAQLLDQNGLLYDSTLCFADRPGFRCGTCREFVLFDLRHRCQLRLRERPLIVMESSIISHVYMGLGYSTEALSLMLRYREICLRFNGDFTLLWHNSHFSRPEDFLLYESLMG
jgi:hypothetical protein